MTRFVSVLALSLAFAFTACGKDDPVVNLSDADVPDATAPPAPDAEPFVCMQTECGDQCVDISTDVNHCGGCNMACARSGLTCSGSLPCECPAFDVPATVGGTMLDQVMPQQGAILAATPVTFGPINVFSVIYNTELNTNEAYSLADAVANQTPPTSALIYDLNTATFVPKSAFAATTGTVTFTELCADGASGTVADVTYEEIDVNSLGGGQVTPLENGCSYQFDSIAFSIGSCPQPKK